ncbi:hypothetical protein B566_EDAN011929 [Ephemera danica]|nr:hypothetical protein B566_EDAN011929 [Ephemera danica]
MVLTWDSADLQLQVMEALTLALQAGKEQLEVTRKRKLRELVPANQEHDAEGLPELTALGEGEDSGDLTPGRSLVFAALEVTLCMLVRQLPALNPMTGKPGLMTALPTLLYLVTGVLGETSALPAGESGATSEAVGAALKCLRTLTAAPLARQDTPLGQQYRRLLQSALGKLLDIAKTSGPDQPDDATVLLGIAVFALHAPADVACTPALLYPSVNHCKRCLQSHSLPVRVQCVQTLRAVFQTPERSVAGAYVHALAPRLVETLYRLTGAATPQRHQPVDDNEVPVVLEGLKTLETLVQLAEPQHRKYRSTATVGEPRIVGTNEHRHPAFTSRIIVFYPIFIKSLQFAIYRQYFVLSNEYPALHFKLK